MARAGGNINSLTQKPLEFSEFGSDNSKFFLEIFPPENGEKRATWFHRFSLAVGINANRLRDLFYDPRCSMRGVELATIQQKWGVLIERQIIALQHRQDALEARIRSIGERNENSTHRRRLRAARRQLGSVRNIGAAQTSE